MSTNNSDECCPRFNPEPWNEKEIIWQNKRFLQDRVTSIFHLPLNYGAVMARCEKAIREADAQTDTRIILTDENSLWGADVFVEVSKDVPNAKMATVSGTFLSKVFEGPFKNIGVWVGEMKSYVAAKNKSMSKLFFYYTTCPKCAKKYGKNYVVLLAQVD
ncbi:MAG: hydrolase [Gallionellaceae bacterium]|jgi:hypothetical protein